MLKIERTVLPSPEQWEIMIEGMRNPKNSWHLSDSVICQGSDGFEDCTISISGVCPRHEDFHPDIFCVGANDHKLMMGLAKGGAVHAKYRRMIPVMMTINAPLYWWKEFDAYKVGTVANSCSTMHKIHAKEFTLDDFSHEHLFDKAVAYNGYIAMSVLECIIGALNEYRRLFLETNNKKYWWQMIQLLPSSYNQKRTVMLNYEVLAKMRCERRFHKIDEWHTFCDHIETLPYPELIIGGDSCV
jgi:hypothetical protein